MPLPRSCVRIWHAARKSASSALAPGACARLPRAKSSRSARARMYPCLLTSASASRWARSSPRQRKLPKGKARPQPRSAKAARATIRPSCRGRYLCSGKRWPRREGLAEKQRMETATRLVGADVVWPVQTRGQSLTKISPALRFFGPQPFSHMTYEWSLPQASRHTEFVLEPLRRGKNESKFDKQHSPSPSGLHSYSDFLFLLSANPKNTDRPNNHVPVASDGCDYPSNATRTKCTGAPCGYQVTSCSFSSLQELKSHRREDGSESPRLLQARLLIGWLKGSGERRPCRRFFTRRSLTMLSFTMLSFTMHSLTTYSLTMLSFTMRSLTT
jgi:hypothetical protein